MFSLDTSTKSTFWKKKKINFYSTDSFQKSQRNVHLKSEQFFIKIIHIVDKLSKRIPDLRYHLNLIAQV